MSKILCSTGALIGRPNNRDYTLLKTFSPQLQCDGFEFMMYESWYGETEEIIDFLKRIRLYTPVMHCEKHIGEAISRNEPGDMEEALRRFQMNCEIASAIGAEKNPFFHP